VGGGGGAFGRVEKLRIRLTQFNFKGKYLLELSLAIICRTVKTLTLGGAEAEPNKN
jgi:hypothetical protein